MFRDQQQAWNRHNIPSHSLQYNWGTKHLYNYEKCSYCLLPVVANNCFITTSMCTILVMYVTKDTVYKLNDIGIDKTFYY